MKALPRDMPGTVALGMGHNIDAGVPIGYMLGRHIETLLLTVDPNARIRRRRGVRIGVNVTLLPSIEIGEGSLIGAGSVVTKDIPPYRVAYGNPALVIRSVYSLKYKSGLMDSPYNEGAAEKMNRGTAGRES